jgi:hypothetical protein
MRTRGTAATAGRAAPATDASPPDTSDSRVAAGRALVLVLAASAVVLVVVNRNQWFGGDEWFIITDRGLTKGPGHLGLFEPHYEHWTTVPILAFRALYSVFGLHSYWPYVSMVIVAHLVLVALLWQVMVRSRVDPWVATASCAVFAVLGTGFENLTTAWQVTLVAPLALGLGAMLLAPESGRFRARDALASGLLTAGMMCSGVGLPVLIAVAIVLLVRRGLRVTALTVAAPLVAYALWYVTYERDAREVATPAPGAIPEFVWHGLTEALGDVARFDAIGVLVVLGVAVWTVAHLARRPFDQRLLVPGALAVGAVCFLAGIGYRRGNLAGSDPAGSRYAYVTVAFVLPLVALAGQSLFRGSRTRRVALVLVTAVLVVAQVRELEHGADIDVNNKGVVVATAALVREGRTFLLARPLGPFEPQLTVGEIAAMDRDGKLPDARPSLQDLLTVLGRLDVVVGPDAAVPAREVARVESVRRANAEPDGAGCVRFRARDGNEVVVRLDAPGTFRVRGDGLLAIRLRQARDRVEGVPVYSRLDPDREQVVSVATVDHPLVLTVPTGAPTVLCGLLE